MEEGEDTSQHLQYCYRCFTDVDTPGSMLEMNESPRFHKKSSKRVQRMEQWPQNRKEEEPNEGLRSW